MSEPNEAEGITFTDPEGREEVLTVGERIQNFSGFVDDEVVSKIIDAFGSVNEFTCAIYHKKSGIGNKTLVGNYRNDIPLPDEIGSVTGSGRLHYMISAKGKSKKREMKDFWVDLGENFDIKADENRIEQNRKLMLRAGGNGNQGSSRSELVALEVLAKLATRESGNSNIEMFRLISENQRASEDRMMNVIDKMTSNFTAAIEKMGAQKNNLQELAGTIALIKEISGSLGGGEQKGIVAEIMEAASPMVCSAIEALTGRRANPALAHEQNEEEETEMNPAKMPVTEENLDLIEKSITKDFDSLVKACKSKLQAAIVRKQFQKAPIFAALFNDAARMERMKRTVGAEKFDIVWSALTKNKGE